MRNKVIVGGIMVLVLVFLQVGISQARGPYAKRHHSQMERIAKGVRCGEVTRREFRYLGNEQRRIQRQRRHSLADGWLSRGERRRLHRMQNRADCDIYRAKHNRWGHKYPNCSKHADRRRYEGRRRTCSNSRRYRVVDDRPNWGFSGFFYDRW